MTRDKAKDRIRELGGRISSGVTKKINYLIAGSNLGLKLQKAQDFEVGVLSE